MVSFVLYDFHLSLKKYVYQGHIEEKGGGREVGGAGPGARATWVGLPGPGRELCVLHVLSHVSVPQSPHTY